MTLPLLAVCLASAPPPSLDTTLPEHLMEVRIALGWQQGVTSSTGFDLGPPAFTSPGGARS